MRWLIPLVLVFAGYIGWALIVTLIFILME